LRLQPNPDHHRRRPAHGREPGVSRRAGAGAPVRRPHRGGGPADLSAGGVTWPAAVASGRVACMGGRDATLAELPRGFAAFHRDRFLNYQLNRAHALGYADGDELRDAAQAIRALDQCPAVFSALSDRAAAAGRLRHATSYLRLAEFFTRKRGGAGVPIYRRYRASFDRAFGGDGAVRHAVPYRHASLPAYRLAANAQP